jgi:hypothetical protein
MVVDSRAVSSDRLVTPVLYTTAEKAKIALNE